MFMKYLQEALLDYQSNNEKHRDDPTLFCEEAKAVLRGKIISYTNVHRKNVQAKSNQASLTLKNA